MNTEKTRLERMLKENKIPQDDYTILLKSLKRKSFFTKLQSSFWLNPFQKIAGFKALIIGVLVLVVTSYVGIKAKLYYLGPLSVINASVLAKQTISHPFLFLLYQNVVSWLVLAILFMVAAKILQKNKMRMIDFLGTVSLAMFPMLLVTLYTYLIRLFYPSILEFDMSKGYPIHFTANQYILTIPILAFIIWQSILCFFALQESSGLNGKKLWWGFLGSLIFASMIAQPLTTLFMN